MSAGAEAKEGSGSAFVDAKVSFDRMIGSLGVWGSLLFAYNLAAAANYAAGRSGVVAVSNSAW